MRKVAWWKLTVRKCLFVKGRREPGVESGFTRRLRSGFSSCRVRGMDGLGVPASGHVRALPVGCLPLSHTSAVRMELSVMPPSAWEVLLRQHGQGLRTGLAAITEDWRRSRLQGEWLNCCPSRPWGAAQLLRDAEPLGLCWVSVMCCKVKTKASYRGVSRKYYCTTTEKCWMDALSGWTERETEMSVNSH